MKLPFPAVLLPILGLYLTAFNAVEGAGLSDQLFVKTDPECSSAINQTEWNAALQEAMAWASETSSYLGQVLEGKSEQTVDPSDPSTFNSLPMARVQYTVQILTGVELDKITKISTEGFSDFDSLPEMDKNYVDLAYIKDVYDQIANWQQNSNKNKWSLTCTQPIYTEYFLLEKMGNKGQEIWLADKERPIPGGAYYFEALDSYVEVGPQSDGICFQQRAFMYVNTFSDNYGHTRPPASNILQLCKDWSAPNNGAWKEDVNSYVDKPVFKETDIEKMVPKSSVVFRLLLQMITGYESIDGEDWEEGHIFDQKAYDGDGQPINNAKATGWLKCFWLARKSYDLAVRNTDCYYYISLSLHLKKNVWFRGFAEPLPKAAKGLGGMGRAKATRRKKVATKTTSSQSNPTTNP